MHYRNERKPQRYNIKNSEENSVWYEVISPSIFVISEKNTFSDLRVCLSELVNSRLLVE